MDNNMNNTESLKIYSGLFEVKRSKLELPIMTLDMSIMSQQKTINGIATIIHDLGDGNIIKSKFRSTRNNFSLMNDGSFLINSTGHPIKKNTKSTHLNSYDCEILHMTNELPNLKILLQIDSSWRNGIVSYKFRTSCDKKWNTIAKVPIDLNQDGLKKVA